MGREVVDEVLHPSEVGVALGRDAVLPAHVVVAAVPVGVVEGLFVRCTGRCLRDARGISMARIVRPSSTSSRTEESESRLALTFCRLFSASNKSLRTLATLAMPSTENLPCFSRMPSSTTPPWALANAL
jgi:hypothetical protein